MDNYSISGCGENRAMHNWVEKLIWFLCILDFSDDGRDEVAGVSVQASQDHTIEGAPLFWENTTKKSISNMVIARRI